jgi:hypothetical protein
VLDIGGVPTRFRLDARGAGDADTPARLRIGRPRRNVARFAARLPEGTFAAALGTNAGLANADARGERRTVRVALLLAPVALSVERPVRYTATRGRRGVARETR